jgi:hypothetical protein
MTSSTMDDNSLINQYVAFIDRFIHQFINDKVFVLMFMIGILQML